VCHTTGCWRRPRDPTALDDAFASDIEIGSGSPGSVHKRDHHGAAVCCCYVSDSPLQHDSDCPGATCRQDIARGAQVPAELLQSNLPRRVRLSAHGFRQRAPRPGTRRGLPGQRPHHRRGGPHPDRRTRKPSGTDGTPPVCFPATTRPLRNAYTPLATDPSTPAAAKSLATLTPVATTASPCRACDHRRPGRRVTRSGDLRRRTVQLVSHLNTRTRQLLG
jgi:hypothetical protein